LPQVPGNSLYFAFYEATKHALAHGQGVPVPELGPGSLMAAGGIGGAAFWVFIYPADVVRCGVVLAVTLVCELGMPMRLSQQVSRLVGTVPSRAS
jgi:hypothetical protein